MKHILGMLNGDETILYLTSEEVIDFQFVPCMELSDNEKVPQIYFAINVNISFIADIFRLLFMLLTSGKNRFAPLFLTMPITFCNRPHLHSGYLLRNGYHHRHRRPCNLLFLLCHHCSHAHAHVLCNHHALFHHRNEV